MLPAVQLRASLQGVPAPFIAPCSSRRTCRSHPVRCSSSSSAPDSDRTGRRGALRGLLAGLAAVGTAGAARADEKAPREGKVHHSDEEWRQLLTPEQYAVLRKASTERRYSSPLVEEHRAGTFNCAGCGSRIFASNSKFESGTGWPSFFEAFPDAVVFQTDNAIPFMPRVEVRCKTCQGHLGHVFDDGPKPTGLRYCMNGAALVFKTRQT